MIVEDSEKNCFLHHEHRSPTLTINALLASEMSIHVYRTTGVTSQDTVIFAVTSVRTSDLTSKLINFMAGYGWPPAAETTA